MENYNRRRVLQIYHVKYSLNCSSVWNLCWIKCCQSSYLHIYISKLLIFCTKIWMLTIWTSLFSYYSSNNKHIPHGKYLWSLFQTCKVDRKICNIIQYTCTRRRTNNLLITYKRLKACKKIMWDDLSLLIKLYVRCNFGILILLNCKHFIYNKHSWTYLEQWFMILIKCCFWSRVQWELTCS